MDGYNILHNVVKSLLAWVDLYKTFQYLCGIKAPILLPEPTPENQAINFSTTFIKAKRFNLILLNVIDAQK